MTFSLVFTSESETRLALLKQIGVEPSVIECVEVCRTPLARELPSQYVHRIATLQATEVAAGYQTSNVLAVETIVACGRRILTQADYENQARTYLSLLSGRRHRVYSALSLYTPQKVYHRMSLTHVALKNLSSQEIDSYLLTNEWYRQPGAYNIQGRAVMFVRWIQGSYTNIVGLPLFELSMLLHGVGLLRL